MKIIIIEVEQDEYKSVSTITLKSRSSNFKACCDEYFIDKTLMNNLEVKGVVGWVDGVNNFKIPVKRTYMLVED